MGGEEKTRWEKERGERLGGPQGRPHRRQALMSHPGTALGSNLSQENYRLLPTQQADDGP